MKVEFAFGVSRFDHLRIFLIDVKIGPGRIIEEKSDGVVLIK